MAVSTVKLAMTFKLQTFAELAVLLNVLIIIVHGAQPTPTSLLLLLPPATSPSPELQRASPANGVKLLCNADIGRSNSLNWRKMLGSWYLEADSQSSPSTSQCVKQMFNYVDMEFGVLDKTIYVVPEKNEENYYLGKETIEERSFAMFDPVNSPNTVMSMIDLHGETIRVQATILDTDYSSYAIGYECGAGSATEDSDPISSTPVTAGFEHMAILTRSRMPLSATKRARLIRRALSLVPREQRNTYTFHQVSKSACGSSVSFPEADKKANKLRLQEKQQYLVVKPEEAAAYIRVDPRSSSIDTRKSTGSRSAPAALMLDGLL